ncbi:MAG: response regulator [Candidatus Sumerlaeia bacterium]|nr:response regulator [Candidatus Sumerlaeia bacterium]
MWRILTVDDEPDVRAIIVASLRNHYEVFEAQDGLDALEKIKRVEPDFVIMDVMMPLMNGFEACDAIRKDPVFRALPVMFLTALGTKEDMKKGYGVGANLYLTKPFDPARLQKNIDVFFETTPPARTHKRYSVGQLRDFEKSGEAPPAPGSTDIHLRETATEGVRKAEEIGPTPDLRGAAAGKPRVLLVDDEHSILDIMRMTLEPAYEVVTAGDGIQAIEKLVRYQPDIMIIDLMLPKMSGFQLLQSLRQNAAFTHLPICVCSAKSSQRDIDLAKRNGSNDYLVKPFDPSALEAMMKRMRAIPGFRVRPKNMTIEQVAAIEAPKEAEDKFGADEEASRQTAKIDENLLPPVRKDSGKALADFLRKEGEKDAFSKAGDGDEKKRRRRLFGFGRSDD